ncbi:PREDICTED: leucine-rich repeat-containing protein 3B-like [Branchiostoma belcheri]|uniref:Leucine-rich repeat-containing protein 3B-like n=1 Tax=Branchiostoma belcheri TaxID=7741 RepID=A0A6P5AB47_BRABE|nr:PREDICTED: leucine-rich repeat-containing protein 3B-like [Branchiostoma belcheri]
MSSCTAVLTVCLILVRLTAALQACTSPEGPGVCSCSGTWVSCSSRNLSLVPDDIPASTTGLSLSYNQITTIENGKKLTSLRLDSNKLTILPSTTFATLNSIRVLDLSNNQITTLDRDTFVGATLEVHFNLNNNPWSCDCRMREILNCPLLNGIICQSPPALSGLSLASLSRDNLTCHSPNITHTSSTLYQAAVGETVTLYCNATGLNRPTLTWSWTPVQPSSAPTDRPHYQVSTTKLDYNSAESTLIIKRVEMSNQGHYICHAANAAGFILARTKPENQYYRMAAKMEDQKRLFATTDNRKDPGSQQTRVQMLEQERVICIRTFVKGIKTTSTRH